MRTIIAAILVASTAGCATPAFKKYEGMNLDAFIDAQPGKEQNNPQRKWAHRVKSFQYKNHYEFQDSFRNWCQAQGGSTLGYGGVTVLSYVDTLERDRDQYRRRHGGSSVCTDKSKTTLAAYSVNGFEDDTIAFYTEAQASALRNEVDRVSKKRKAESEAEDKRKSECHAEKTRAIRANLRPGIHTNYGMVIEVKPPLAQLQVPSENGSALQWVEIARLGPPYGACN